MNKIGLRIFSRHVQAGSRGGFDEIICTGTYILHQQR